MVAEGALSIAWGASEALGTFIGLCRPSPLYREYVKGGLGEGGPGG